MLHSRYYFKLYNSLTTVHAYIKSRLLPAFSILSKRTQLFFITFYVFFFVILLLFWITENSLKSRTSPNTIVSWKLYIYIYTIIHCVRYMDADERTFENKKWVKWRWLNSKLLGTSNIHNTSSVLDSHIHVAYAC